MKPTIGRIVQYNCTKSDKIEMEERNKRHLICNVVDTLPAIVTNVFGDGGFGEAVNLKVQLDGVGEFWKTTVSTRRRTRSMELVP